MNDYWAITDKETKDTKWALMVNELSGAMPKDNLLTKKLEPVFNAQTQEPRLFDSKKEVMEWIKDIKERIGEFIKIPDNIDDDKIIITQNKISKILDSHQSYHSLILLLMLHKEIDVDDFEDGIKVSYVSHKNTKGYYIFKPVIVKKEV